MNLKIERLESLQHVHRRHRRNGHWPGQSISKKKKKKILSLIHSNDLKIEYL